MSALVSQPQYFRTSRQAWGLLFVLAAVSGWFFFDAIGRVVGRWTGAEGYGHGVLIPLITAYLIWQKRKKLAGMPFQGSWAGVALTAAAMIVYLVADRVPAHGVVAYLLLLILFGMVWAVVGSRILKEIWVPLLFLAFVIKLPSLLYSELTAKLQLVASVLGASFLGLCNISVYREGTVIDLGTMQLVVEEGCSGIRYLLSLMTLAFICAYLYQAPFWKRAVVFLSSIPIAILTNGFRIGVTGILGKYGGRAMAEGFLHEVEGLVIFPACVGMLIAVMWLLTFVGTERRPFSAVFGLDAPAPLPPNATFKNRELPMQFWSVGAMLLAALGFSLSLDPREDIVPQRVKFLEFPMRMGNWSGSARTLERPIDEVLNAEDYVLADYKRPGEPAAVNFFAAYYGSAQKSRYRPTPDFVRYRGWEITASETKAIEGASVYAQPLRVNRLTIQKGLEKQLVYFWFQQREHNLTTVSSVKWYGIWDGVTRNRTDGALVRIVTDISGAEGVEQAVRRLADFIRVLAPELEEYVPR